MTQKKNNTRGMTIGEWMARDDWKLEFLSPQVMAYRAVDVTGAEYWVDRDGHYEPCQPARA